MFRKSLKRSAVLSSSIVGAANCSVVVRPAQIRRGCAKRFSAELRQRLPVHLGEAHLQHDLLAVVAAGQLQHVDDLAFRSGASRSRRPAASPRLLDTARQDRWPRRSTVTRMSSPGNSDCAAAARATSTPASTTRSYCIRCAAAPDDQADRARRLAVDRGFRAAGRRPRRRLRDS